MSGKFVLIMLLIGILNIALWSSFFRSEMVFAEHSVTVKWVESDSNMLEIREDEVVWPKWFNFSVCNEGSDGISRIKFVIPSPCFHFLDIIGREAAGNWTYTPDISFPDTVIILEAEPYGLPIDSGQCGEVDVLLDYVCEPTCSGSHYAFSVWTSDNGMPSGVNNALLVLVIKRACVHNLDTKLNYTTIQEAIDANETLDGNTIFVEEGIYYEHVVVDKSLSLLGEDKDATIIDGNYSGKVVEINSDNIVVNGFTICNHGKEWHDSGLYVIGNNCTISRNKVITNTTQDSFLIQKSLPDAKTKIKAIPPPRTYGILLRSSCNNCISDNYVVDRIAWDIHDPMKPILYGIGLIFDSNNNSILNNNMLACSVGGLFLEYRSNNNEIRDNYLVDNGIGVHSYLDCTNNIMSNNYIEGNNEGIRIYGSYNERVINNSLINNDYGIWLEYDGGHLVINNDIVDSSVCGINIPQTSHGWYNTIYHNNFVNNLQQVLIYEKSSNVWDDGYPSGGNYWSDYPGVDLDHDGIGDTTHEIDADNTDHNPLMGMFHSFNTSLGYNVNVISNSTIENFEYFQSDKKIRMHVSNMTGNQTFGFCRICIPRTLMNETYRVFVNGTEIIPAPLPLPCSNSTHNYLYFNYTHSTEEIVIIPEFPSFLILPLFMIATLLAVIVYRRKHIR